MRRISSRISGFESGTAGSYPGAMGDGWVVTAGIGAICNNSGAGCGNAGVAHSGNQMGYLDWSNSFNSLTQTLTTTVGQTYAISYWVADTHPNLHSVSFGGSTLFSGTAPVNSVDSPDNYSLFTFFATATSTSTVLAFSGQRTAGATGRSWTMLV